MELSPLANALLLQHRAAYSEAHGYSYEFHQVSGYSEDEVAAGYEELARAGLMEPDEPASGASRRRYRLTGTSSGSSAILLLPQSVY